MFEGGFECGARHGHGIFRWPSGAHFVGQFANDRRHGLGTLTHPDNTVDHGMWMGVFLTQFLPPPAVKVPPKKKEQYAKEAAADKPVKSADAAAGGKKTTASECFAA